MANKVKFGLKNVYYSKITETQGADTYGTPVAIPGAVSISVDAQGDTNKFYADNSVYYQSVANNGYEGTLTMALIPDAFRKDILGELEDDNDLLVEKVDAPQVRFALLFEFDGDANKRRHILYNCTASRPAMASATTEEAKEPQTEELAFSAIANKDGYVKASCDEGTTKYATFFTTVAVPTFTPPSP